MQKIKHFIRDDSGQDMVEYGLLAGFIALVAMAALIELGPAIKTVFENITDRLGGVPS